MDMNWFQIIGPAAGVVGVLLAAWLAYLAAVPRVRRERAFERRLIWIETMMSVVEDLAFDLESALNAQWKTGNGEWCEPVLSPATLALWQRVAERLKEFHRASKQGRIYAARNDLEIIYRLEEHSFGLWRDTAGFTDLHKADFPMMAKHAERLRDFGRLFAERAREHLELQ